LAMMPSSPWAREASSSPAPLPTWFAGVCQVGPVSPSSASFARRSS